MPFKKRKYNELPKPHEEVEDIIEKKEKEIMRSPMRSDWSMTQFDFVRMDFHLRNIDNFAIMSRCNLTFANLRSWYASMEQLYWIIQPAVIKERKDFDNSFAKIKDDLDFLEHHRSNINTAKDLLNQLSIVNRKIYDTRARIGLAFKMSIERTERDRFNDESL